MGSWTVREYEDTATPNKVQVFFWASGLDASNGLNVWSVSSLRLERSLLVYISNRRLIYSDWTLKIRRSMWVSRSKPLVEDEIMDMSLPSIKVLENSGSNRGNDRKNAIIKYRAGGWGGEWSRYTLSKQLFKHQIYPFASILLIRFLL